MQAITLSKENVFEGSTNIDDPGACATLASKRILVRLILFAEKSKSDKLPFERHNGTVKRDIYRDQTLMFLTFFINKNLLLYIGIKSFNFRCNR